eukprot:jgi/Tetstr1/439365/TSEL_027800.t1
MREWEDGTGGGVAPTRSQPGRAAMTKTSTSTNTSTRECVSSSKHGTVERDAAYFLPYLAEAEAFNITDVDGGQPTGMLYKTPAGTLCRQPPALPHPKAARRAGSWAVPGARVGSTGSSSSSQSCFQISKAVCAFTASEALAVG